MKEYSKVEEKALIYTIIICRNSMVVIMISLILVQEYNQNRIYPPQDLEIYYPRIILTADKYK
jgi:hypothetical protein